MCFIRSDASDIFLLNNSNRIPCLLHPPQMFLPFFLFQVEKIRQVKAKSLYLQVEKLHQSLTKLDSTIAAVSQVLDEGRHLDVLLARERMLTQIHELKTLRGLLQAQEDDRFMFTPPDQVDVTVF